MEMFDKLRPVSPKVHPTGKTVETSLNREPTKNELKESLNATYTDDYIMPSLPMKFSFNKIYIAPPTVNTVIADQEPIDYSLKAIFSSNANSMQRVARRNFLLKTFLAVLIILIVLIVAIVVIVLLTNKEESTTSTSTTPELTYIDWSLVNDLALSPNGNLLAASSLDGEVNVYLIGNVNNPLPKYSWKPHNSPTVVELWTDDYLISGSLDIIDAIKIWSRLTETLDYTFAQSSLVQSLCLVNDSLLLSGHTDSSISKWDLNTKTQLSVLVGSGGEVNKIIMLSSGLVAAAYLNTINLWNLDTDQNEGTFSSSKSINDMIQINSNCIVTCHDEEIVFWDMSFQSADGTITLNGETLYSMFKLTNTSLIYGTQTDLAILTYEFNNEPFFIGDKYNGSVKKYFLNAHSAQINDIIKLDDDNKIVSGSNDGFIRFWSL